MRTDHNPDSQKPGHGLGSESQSWVNASLPRNSWFDWRELLLRGMYFTGALGLARRFAHAYEIRPTAAPPWRRLHRAQKPKLAILCYHGIGESGNPLGDATSQEAFEAQVQFLHRHYRIISLEEVWRSLRDPEHAEPGVAITFDDGYRNAYTVAFPILQKYDVTATIFVAVDAVETGQILWYDRVFLAMAVAPGGPLDIEIGGHFRFRLDSPADRWRAALELVAWFRTLPDSRRRECCALLERKIGLPQGKLSGLMLTWEQIQTMHRAGISFGSHTLTHPVVSQLTPAELERELIESKRTLEKKLGTPVLDFAYPFGKPSDCSVAAVEALSRYGYRSAVTTVPGVNPPQANPYMLRRIQVGHSASVARFSFELNQAFFRPLNPIALSEFPAEPTRHLQTASSAGNSDAFGGADA